jgi:hypothetical protein
MHIIFGDKMKKNILTFIFTFIIINIIYSAEITVGTRLGAGINANFNSPSVSSVLNSSPLVSQNESSHPGFSFSAGILASFMFKGANYGFEFQFNYARYLTKINDDIYTGRQNLYINSLEAAIPFKMSLLAGKIPSEDVHHPYVLIGPVFSFPLKVKLAGSDVTGKFNDVNLGMLVALGGRLRLKGNHIVFVEIEFKAFFTDKLKTCGKLRDFRFQFCIGYEFNLTKGDW